jgi:hypothetical protein
MPITPTLPGADIITTMFIITIITPLSKENTKLILRDGASTTNVLSVKIIGTEGIDSNKAGLGRILPVMGSERD